MSGLLTQPFVLIPVLDDQKHYWVAEHEIEKLLRRGEFWLPSHPARDLITRRYLKYQKRLARLVAASTAELYEELWRRRSERKLLVPFRLLRLLRCSRVGG